MKPITENLVFRKGWDWTSLTIEKSSNGKLNAIIKIQTGNEQYFIKVHGLFSTMWFVSWELESEYDLALFVPGTKDQYGNIQTKYIFGFQNKDDEINNLTTCDLIEIEIVG